MGASYAPLVYRNQRLKGNIKTVKLKKYIADGCAYYIDLNHG